VIRSHIGERGKPRKGCHSAIYLVMPSPKSIWCVFLGP
jgi:hypothetical protein